MGEDKSTIKILIADDHHVVRQGLEAILELENDFQVIGQTQDGRRTIAEAKRFKPDVILMDIRMPGLNGIATSKEVKEACPDTKIIILTSFETEDEVKEATRVGVDGYLLKDMGAEEIIKAVRAVAAGRSYLHPSVAKKVLKNCRSSKEQESESSGLTGREIEILGLMAEGLKNKEIAKKLWISEATVKAHVSQIFQKLEVSDRAQAVLSAVRKGLITMEVGEG